MKKSYKKLSEKDKTLHAQFSRYGRNAREWMRKCALLLPEIERNRVWEKKGFDDIYEYAAKLAGMGHDAVNDSLRILKKIEDKPELMKVVEEKGLLAVKPVATIATPETAKFWAEKAKIMSRHTLETYVRELVKQEGVLSKNSNQIIIGEDYSETNVTISQNGLFMLKTDNVGRSGTAEIPDFPQQEAITILVDNEIAEQLKKLKGQGDWNELIKELLKLREEKLTSELKEIEQKEIKKIIKKKNKIVVAVKQNDGSEIEGTILNEGTKTTKAMMAAAEQNNDSSETKVHKNELYKAKNHQPSSRIKKYVLHKTNHTCAFPGCTKPAEHLHHTERFGISGRHDPDKIIPLCKEHHELAHDGLIENEDEQPNEWGIRLEADMTDYKYTIDQQVAKYRRN